MTEASISTEISGPFLIVRLGDEFMVFPDQFDPVDAAVSTALESDEQASLKCVVIDCQHVAHLSSVSLGKLVALHKSLDSSERALRICGLNESITETMKVTQLNALFNIYADDAAATAEPN